MKQYYYLLSFLVEGFSLACSDSILLYNLFFSTSQNRYFTYHYHYQCISVCMILFLIANVTAMALAAAVSVSQFFSCADY
jgi:hypothetical protein